MAGAFLWGAIAASSLLVGGFIAQRVEISSRVLGWIMAFGAGVLISAVAFELVEEALITSTNKAVVEGGLISGSVAFFVGNHLLQRMGGKHRKRSHGGQAEGEALPIVLGIVLDGVPESIVLGLTLFAGDGLSVAFFAAVLLSNLPESLAATTGLAKAGWRASNLLWMWTLVVAVSGVASLAGYAVFDDASPHVIAFVLTFAAGAILTMLADTMMPEAFADAGPLVGILTTIGFGVAYFLTLLD